MKRKLIVLLMVCAMLSACSGQAAQTTAEVENSSLTSSSTIESSLPESEASSSSEASSETEKVYAVERIDLETDSFDGFVGDAVVITPAVYPTMVKDSVLTYSSTDEAVVTVDETGSGTLTGVGSAEIVVTDEASGVEARFSVTAQAVPQTSKPTGDTQQQTSSGGTGSTGDVQLPKAGYITDEEHRQSNIDAFGMTGEEFALLEGDEYIEAFNNIDWGY